MYCHGTFIASVFHNDEHTFPLQMVWKTLYCQSSRDHGTLGYFRSKLNRTSVTSEPKKDVNACLDFLLTVVKGHLLAAACELLHVQNPESSLDLPPVRDADQQSEFINSIARDIVNKYTLIGSAYTSEGVLETNDGVVNYATILCHYGALIVEFLDAWAEGDGERIYRCWKLFLPHFLATGRTKYSLQALHLQFQVEAALSPHLAHHILWDRFINTKGGIGHNIPCDLHNEHINKLLKELIVNMGSNITQEALQRAARSVSAIDRICRNFEKTSGVVPGTSMHSTRSDDLDVRKVVEVVV